MVCEKSPNGKHCWHFFVFKEIDKCCWCGMVDPHPDDMKKEHGNALNGD